MVRPVLLVAIVLMLLPLAYVGSYLALVTPGRVRVIKYESGEIAQLTFYRVDGHGVEKFFWPLEEFDTWARPEAWERPGCGR